ncbi:MAG: hypothetical protein HOC36_02905 [Candidatus Magasanikbacteria bacterium]|jgi:hypothetical protein|nr:hypothetical protein [Candidatus Magasanikbacteria bacterium]MBT4547271.1 hypothetical protein [Candidatus Magasanikbacteria bacterium]
MVKKEKDTKIEKVRKFDPQEIRKDVVFSLRTMYDPDTILKKLDSKLREASKNKKDIHKDEETQKIMGQASSIMGLETHYPLVHSISEEYCPFAMELTNNLYKEYDCKTSSQKILAQAVVNSYVRVLRITRKMDSVIGIGHTTPGINGFLSVLSKELDRANRHLISLLESLKNFNTPEMKVSIRTNNAFVAQNQQLNNNQNETNKQ